MLFRRFNSLVQASFRRESLLSMAIFHHKGTNGTKEHKDFIDKRKERIRRKGIHWLGTRNTRNGRKTLVTIELSPTSVIAEISNVMLDKVSF
jgi:hypothetical protein